ncbi:MAG: hypothetical protein IPL79_12635 [Myxococcales bacterium]|nr:hypothetical protein [Myxococcales bacterium]
MSVPMEGTPRTAWIFSRDADLLLFGGTAVVALLWLWFAQAQSHASGEEPAMLAEATWIATVLLVDVAHVWSTGLIVYLDRSELARRRWLYTLTPIACFGVGAALYGWAGAAWFWRVLAYLAVLHFVRQQFGWVMMYRGRAGEHTRWGRLIDGAAIYAATVVPLIWWHAHLPRSFDWFVDGDFANGLAPWVADAALVLGAIIAVLYVARALIVAGSRANLGKHLVIATTAACWFGGIVLTNSDIAFTVTNVLIHGVPYLALVYLYARQISAPRSVTVASVVRLGPWFLLITLWAIAFAEELLWDRAVWHERSYLFGDLRLPGGAALWVALLATPQATHYVLDAFLWRRASNPQLARLAAQPRNAEP